MLFTDKRTNCSEIGLAQGKKKKSITKRKIERLSLASLQRDCWFDSWPAALVRSAVPVM